MCKNVTAGSRLRKLLCLTSIAGMLLNGQLVAQGQSPTSSNGRQATDLQIGKLRVGKILFLGNSITLHGPAPQIGWHGNWGMAASSAEKDYVHLLVCKIEEKAGGKPAILVQNLADFERQLKAYDLKQGLQKAFAFQPDLVIVALGENAAALSTDKAKSEFRAAFADLLTQLVDHGHPTIFVRSSFWADPVKDEIMQQACQAAGGRFVDMSQLGRDESNAARSERHFEHAGVAAHPGDRGMQAIADALWQAIERQSGTAAN